MRRGWSIPRLEEEIACLEDEIRDLRRKLDELRREEAKAWPDKPTLLAVYGAPGNWPVEAS